MKKVAPNQLHCLGAPIEAAQYFAGLLSSSEEMLYEK